MRFYFNTKAWESLAKELRRASWGTTAVTVAAGYHGQSGKAIMLAGTLWTVLQILALCLDSVQGSIGAEK